MVEKSFCFAGLPVVVRKGERSRLLAEPDWGEEARLTWSTRYRGLCLLMWSEPFTDRIGPKLQSFGSGAMLAGEMLRYVLISMKTAATHDRMSNHGASHNPYTHTHTHPLPIFTGVIQVIMYIGCLGLPLSSWFITSIRYLYVIKDLAGSFSSALHLNTTTAMI